jgi:hypothetical protein
MKTALAVVVAVLGAAIWLSLLPRVRAATVPNAQTGRYSIIALTGRQALMVDTETGAVWDFVYSNYCQNKTNPSEIREVGEGKQCKDEEAPLSSIYRFDRVSVEGLYTTGIQKGIDLGVRTNLMRNGRQTPATPKN